MHPLVRQLRFARLEFERVMAGVTAEEGVVRLLPTNSLSWMVAHLANQEQFYWLVLPQGRGEASLYPDLNEQVGFGKPASTPDWDEAWGMWREITTAVDGYLDALEAHQLREYFVWREKRVRESIGSMLQRNIYHYWFHIGEAHAVRQQMGHVDLPQFVGPFGEAVYAPELAD